MLFSCARNGTDDNRLRPTTSVNRWLPIRRAFTVIPQLLRQLPPPAAIRPAPLPTQLRGKTTGCGLYCRARRGSKLSRRAHRGRLPMPMPQDKPRRRLWRRPLFLIPFGLLLTLALGIAALVLAPPVALVREQLARIVEEATGRELKVLGAVKLAFYPRPSLVLGDVTLAGPPDDAGPDLLRAERIAGEVNPLPLLSGKTEISRLEIVRPTLTVRPEDRALLDRISQ